MPFFEFSINVANLFFSSVTSLEIGLSLSPSSLSSSESFKTPRVLFIFLTNLVNQESFRGGTLE